MIPVLPVVDTIKQVDEAGSCGGHAGPGRAPGGADPAGLPAVDVLEQRPPRRQRSTHTDDAGLAERIGVPVFCVPGADAAMKITRPADLAAAELLLDGTGSGATTLGS